MVESSILSAFNATRSTEPIRKQQATQWGMGCAIGIPDWCNQMSVLCALCGCLNFSFRQFEIWEQPPVLLLTGNIAITEAAWILDLLTDESWNHQRRKLARTNSRSLSSLPKSLPDASAIRIPSIKRVSYLKRLIVTKNLAMVTQGNVPASIQCLFCISGLAATNFWL